MIKSKRAREWLGKFEQMDSWPSGSFKVAKSFLSGYNLPRFWEVTYHFSEESNLTEVSNHHSSNWSWNWPCPGCAHKSQKKSALHWGEKCHQLRKQLKQTKRHQYQSFTVQYQWPIPLQTPGEKYFVVWIYISEYFKSNSTCMWDVKILWLQEYFVFFQIFWKEIWSTLSPYSKFYLEDMG